MKKLILAVALLCAISYGQTKVSPLLQPHQTFADQGGAPCAGCALFSYTAGTTIPTPTYQDAGGTVPNTNPIILSVQGGANIWVDTSVSYKFVLKNTSGTTLWTVDHVKSPGAGLPAEAIVSNPSASQVITQPSGTNFSVNTSGGGKEFYNGAEVLTSANTSDFLKLNPSGPQTTTQPLYGPSFNNLGTAFVHGLTTFGDSICVYAGASTTAKGFVSYLAGQVGPPLNNTCISGWWIQGEPLQMYLAGTAGYNGSTVTPPTQGNNPLNIEEGGKNDATGCTSNPDCNMNSQLALTTVLTHRGTNNITQAANATTTGTWVTDSVLPSSKSTTSNGATITFGITTYGSSAIGVAYKAATGNGGTASVKIDGVTQTQGIVASGFNGFAINTGTNPSVFTNLYPATAGTHVVVITVTSATAAGNEISIPDVVSAGNPASSYAPPFIASMEIIPYQNNTNPTWIGTLNTMKQNLVSTLKGYGFNVQYLPISNVPCTNGVSGCIGGLNNAAYISNQPGVFDPDKLSCAGSTTDNVHPNDCGHKQIFQAIQKDLNIVQSVANAAAAQNIYTTSRTIEANDGILYFSGSGLTLTLPATLGPSGPYFINNIGTADLSLVGASGATLFGIPATIPGGKGIIVQNYGPNWFIANNLAAPLVQNSYTANHTLATGDSVVYMSGSGLTLTLPSTLASGGPYYITNTGSSTVTIASPGFLNNIPAALLAGHGITIANNGSNWFELSGTQTVTAAASPALNRAACIKSQGPPIVLGYCSTVLDTFGACTCN